MKKITLLGVLFVFVLASMLMAAAPGYNKLSVLTVINKSEADVKISLTACDDRVGSTTYGKTFFYYFVVPPCDGCESGVKSFEVERLVYSRKTWTCQIPPFGGLYRSGTLDMTGNVRLVFTSCWHKVAPNAGEPTQEKVHIKDTPGFRVAWRYWR